MKQAPINKKTKSKSLKKMPSPGPSELGVSLISVVIGVALLGIAAAAFTRVMNFQERSGKSQSYDNQIDEIRQFLFERIDCINTLSSAGIINDSDLTKVSCPANSSSSGLPYQKDWQLRDKNNKVIGNAPDIHGIKLYPDWYMRVGCSFDETSLVVRVAGINDRGEFLKDPITKRTIDWKSPDGLLFGRDFPFCLNKAETPKSQIMDSSFSVSYSQYLIGNGKVEKLPEFSISGEKEDISLYEIMVPKSGLNTFLRCENEWKIYTANRYSSIVLTDGVIRARKDIFFDSDLNRDGDRIVYTNDMGQMTVNLNTDEGKISTVLEAICVRPIP